MARKTKTDVFPVKDVTDIAMVDKFLTKHYGELYSDIWNFGINTALRISDILAAKYSDINRSTNELFIQELKTGKTKRIKLTGKIGDIVNRREANNPDHVYIFQSNSNRAKSSTKPMGQSRIYNALKEAGEFIGVKMGTHSMRKTRGYHVYKRNRDIAEVMVMLNHSSPAVTLKYIGITDEDQDRITEEVVL